jgi:sulfide:quinone oxidoreductase
MVGRRTAQAITRPLSRLTRKGIDVRTGTVERFDPERRTVTVDGQPIVADYLVIALGAELAPEAVPGLAADPYLNSCACGGSQHEQANRRRDAA